MLTQLALHKQQSSRKGMHEEAKPRTFHFKKLQMCVFKTTRQSRQQLVRIQSALCEIACKDLENECSCLQKGCKQRRI